MLRRMPRSEVLGRAKDLLDAFDLTDAGGKRVCDYSSGMTKKIRLVSWQAVLTRGADCPMPVWATSSVWGTILVLFLVGLTLGAILIQLAFLG